LPAKTSPSAENTTDRPWRAGLPDPAGRRRRGPGRAPHDNPAGA